MAKRQCLILALLLVTLTVCGGFGAITGRTDAENDVIAMAKIMPPVDLTLPTEVPFEIIIIRGGGGIVQSRENVITNNGDFPVQVALDAAHFTIDAGEHGGDFAISGTDQLPNSGNNIYIAMTMAYNNEETTYVLGDAPLDTAESFELMPGESVAFSLSGVVNELGTVAWEETVVTFRVTYRVEIPEEVLAALQEQESQAGGE